MTNGSRIGRIRAYTRSPRTQILILENMRHGEGVVNMRSMYFDLVTEIKCVWF